MEHGLLMLSGQGGFTRLRGFLVPCCRRRRRHLMAGPYCSQWFVAMGKKPASYLYYKRLPVNRARLTGYSGNRGLRHHHQRPVGQGGKTFHPRRPLLDYSSFSRPDGAASRSCAEGDCGACTVVARRPRRLWAKPATGRSTAASPFFRCLPAGRIVTVEALASGANLHPVQQAMVEPTTDLSAAIARRASSFRMFEEAYYRKDCKEPWQINDQLSGSTSAAARAIDRIRDAASEVLAKREGMDLRSDPFARRLDSGADTPPALDYASEGGRFLRPASLPGTFPGKWADQPSGSLGRRGDRKSESADQ